MRGALLLAFLLQAPPGEVVVREGESLPQVAERTLGDPRGASELKALNRLQGDTVPPGTTLKLPGLDRTLAQGALAAARNAVSQADARAERREEAAAKLREAEFHFQSARYTEAARAADGAWRLVSASASSPSVFTVEVAEDGATTVRTVSGQPVRVEAEGVHRPVYPGESIRMEKGSAPPPLEPPPPLLPAPQLVQPADARQLFLRPTRGGLGPVTLAWQAVEGAERYEVELIPAAGERRLLTVSTTRTRLPLPAGSYRWRVRAVGKGAQSAASPEWRFEVAKDTLRLDVKGSSWK